MTNRSWLRGGLLVLLVAVSALALETASAASMAVLDLPFPNTAHAVTAPASSPGLTVQSRMSDTITSTNQISGSFKVAIAIARYFSPAVTVTEVISMHQAGWGYGEIFKAYQYAFASGVTVANIEAMRQQGMGWGEIAKNIGQSPGNKGVNLGSAVSGRGVSGTVTSTVGSGVSPGKSGDKGKPDNPGNSNPKPDDKGKPDDTLGNGNGNGPGNNPGNGNGNGKKK